MDDKPDIIEFIENYCGLELLEYQKEFIRKAYSAGPDAKLVFPRHIGRTDYKLLVEMIALSLKEKQNERRSNH